MDTLTFWRHNSCFNSPNHGKIQSIVNRKCFGFFTAGRRQFAYCKGAFFISKNGQMFATQDFVNDKIIQVRWKGDGMSCTVCIVCETKLFIHKINHHFLLCLPRVSGVTHYLRGYVKITEENCSEQHHFMFINWLISQTAHCTCPISHNAPFCNRNGALWDICLMHCGVCEVGLLSYSRSRIEMWNKSWTTPPCYL